MKPIENNEDAMEYLIQARCMDCKTDVTLVTNEADLARVTRKGALFFGPCPRCNAAFLQIVGL